MCELSARPRRSVLYMPGANPKALAKARTLAADALIFDLEDAVSPAAKDEARANVVAAITEGGYGQREVVVRINALGSPWGRDDLAAVAELPIDGVVLPKVESAEDVIAAANLLVTLGAAEMPIWAMLETPLGVLHAGQIAQASPRLQALVMGTNDLAKELRIPQTLDRAGFMTSLGLCVLAARAYGVDIIDGVYIHIKDEAGLRQSCEQGKQLGFDGKTLIHPGQLAIANEVFGPSAAEITEAEQLLAAWRDAEAQGKGVVVVNDRLVEELHVVQARRVLDLAQRIAQLAE